jgi:hypothetical protein
MAACKSCGQKAGMGKDLCTSCKGKQEAERQRVAEEQAQARRLREQEEAAQAARELEERTSAYVDESLAQIRTALERGLTPSLLTVETLTTTYALNGAMSGAPPDMTRLAVYAANGWETLATIPQTEGTGLTNRTGNGGTIWAGGVGGLVTGVYVVLRLPLTREFLEANEQYVRDAVRAQFVDGVSTGLLTAGFAPATLQEGRNAGSTLVNVGLGVAGGFLVADAVGDMMGGGDVGDFDGGGGGMDFGGFDF